MHTTIKDQETYDLMIQRLLSMQEEAMAAMRTETEAIDNIVSNIFTKTAHYLKHNKIEETQKGPRKLQSYENIMQNLLTLKEATMEAKRNEAESIETVLHKLLTFCDYNVSPLPGTVNDEDIEAIFQVQERVAVNIN